MTATSVEAEITRLLRSGMTVSDVILHGQQTRAWRLEDVAAVIKACGLSVGEDDRLTDRSRTPQPVAPPSKRQRQPARTRTYQPRRAPAGPPVECGTAKGYRRHRKLGDPYCGPCNEEWSRVQKAYRDRHRKGSAA